MFGWCFQLLNECAQQLHLFGDFSVLLVILLYQYCFLSFIGILFQSTHFLCYRLFDLFVYIWKLFLLSHTSHCNGIFLHFGGFQTKQFPVLSWWHTYNQFLLCFSNDFVGTNQIKTHLIPMVGFSLLWC
jgi:hypothetical protein